MNAEPKRIEHLTASGGLYGIEHVLLNLLPVSRRRGADHGLTVFGRLDGPDGLVGREMAKLGVPVGDTGQDGRLRPLFGLDRRLRQLRPRAIHMHGYKAIIFGGLVALVRKIPAVVTYHAEAFKVRDFRFFSAIIVVESWIMRRVAGVIAVSEPVRAELLKRGVADEKIRVIPNGVALSTVAGVARVRTPDLPAGPVVLVAGRLAPEKRVDRAIRAVADLRADFPTVSLVIAGDGPLRAELEQLSASLGLTDAIHFRGYVSAVRALMRGCDCFVVPSQTEGSPMALLDAMAEGAPIVASNVGGIPATMTNDVEGFVVNADNHAELVDAMRRVLRDRALAQRLGEGAQRRFIAQYSADGMSRSYEEFYATVL